MVAKKSKVDKLKAIQSDKYWKDRQARLISSLEKDEKALMTKLDKYYDTQGKALERQIGRFYGMYGQGNVIEYRTLLKGLSEGERDILYKDFTAFMDKYPQYSHLEPIRGQIYKLDRLEGLRVSMLMEQMEIAGYEQAEIEKHLLKTCNISMIDSLNMLGFGTNFNMISPDVAKKLINTSWVGGENFSQRIWKNREALANHLTEQFRNSVIRGDTYKQCTNLLVKKFQDVSRRDAERLIRTEGTYIMNEASITPFEKEFKQYKYSAIFDQRTSEVCKELDGQVFDMNKRQPGSNFPPMHPWCRSGYEVVIPKDWLDKKLEEVTGVKSPEIDQDRILPKDVKIRKIDETSKTAVDKEIKRLEERLKAIDYLVDHHSDKYIDGDWDIIDSLSLKLEKELSRLKSITFNKVHKLTGMGEVQFVQAKTLKEADEFAKKHLGVKCSYKGLDVRVANEWNKGIFDMKKEFPEVLENIKFIGSVQERNRLMKKDLKDCVINEFKNKGYNIANEHIQSQIDATCRRLYRQLGINKVESDLIAQSFFYPVAEDSIDDVIRSFNGITVNKAQGGNYDKLLETLKEQVERKFHSQRNPTIKGIFDHEFGHQIDKHYEISKKEEIIQLRKSKSNQEMTSELCTYAWRNRNKDICGEMIAEAWAEYKNSDNPREIATKVGKIIERCKK